MNNETVGKIKNFRVGVLSDTHIPRRGSGVPEAVFEGLRGVNLILHAGDINKDHVIYELEEIAPVEAVAGNTDDEYIRGMLGTRKIIIAGSCKIGLIHGDGASGTTLDRAIKAFRSDKLDCIVFGHSHIPYNRVVNGVLLFNPGSPTDKRRQEQFSYGILTIEAQGVKGKICYF